MPPDQERLILNRIRINQETEPDQHNPVHHPSQRQNIGGKSAPSPRSKRQHQIISQLHLVNQDQQPIIHNFVSIC